MKELYNLYNGIMNDYSVRRNTMGWEVIIEKLQKRYKTIGKTDVKFTDDLLSKALSVSSGSLKKDIISFIDEMAINLETLRNKRL